MKEKYTKVSKTSGQTILPRKIFCLTKTSTKTPVAPKGRLGSNAIFFRAEYLFDYFSVAGCSKSLQHRCVALLYACLSARQYGNSPEGLLNPRKVPSKMQNVKCKTPYSKKSRRDEILVETDNRHTQ